MKLRKNIYGLLRIIVAIGLLVYFLEKVPLSLVLISLSSAHPGTIIAAVFISLVTQIIVAVRLQSLAFRQEIYISLYKALGINLARFFYGLFLPGGNLTGGAIRFFRLSGPKRKIEAALSTIIYDRIDATLGLLTLGLLFWIIDRMPGFGNIGLGALVILAGLLVSYGALFSKWRGLEYLTNRSSMFQASLDNFRNLPLSTRIRIFSLSITSHLSGIMAYSLLAGSLGIDISFLTIGWIRSFTILATMIPVSLSGLGIREGILLILLGTYGIPGEVALAFSFLVFGVTVLLPGLLGGLMETKIIIDSKE